MAIVITGREGLSHVVAATLVHSFISFLTASSIVKSTYDKH
jgi:hypothetical protein